VVATLLGAAMVAACTVAPGTPLTVHVDVASDLGPTNPALRGFSHNTGSATAVAALQPPIIRIDARPQNVSPAPGVYDMTALLARVADVRAAGAEPLVVLSGMPSWLAGDAAPGPLAGGSETRPPKDFDQWQELVRHIMEVLALQPQPTRMYEVWNEPDYPGFWSGTAGQFGELAVRVHRAALEVESATGVDLEVGGPAAALPNSAIVGTYLAALKRAGIVPDFVSWHQYPNLLLGPDGPESPGEPLWPELAGRNPFMSPQQFGSAIAWTRGVVAHWFPDDVGHIRLGITEWNLSAGGLDLRNETNDGAAFTAAALTVFEQDHLDFSTIYRSVGSDQPGDWGTVDLSGAIAPRWDVYDAFRRTDGRRLALTGADPTGGVWARATKTSGGSYDVILSSYNSSPDHGPARTARITGLPDGPVVAHVLDAAHQRLAETSARRDGSTVTIELPPQSMVWLTVTPSG
jgi:hypothetical protein